ncbi:hypothetical protein BGZ76_004507 [Entomortierella beljakovae]|nr:hypothetical protein BGZ76_004507 [Entomortierella beljakovae]
MFRAISTSSNAIVGLGLRQTRVQFTSGFHHSTASRNNSSSGLTELLATLRNKNAGSSISSSSNSANDNASSIINKTSSLFGGSRIRSGGSNRSDISLFGNATKANVTSNPIHLDTNHPTEGRSFKVNSPALVEQTYKRLRIALNQSNIKRELRLRRTYEDGHTRMRRENQERNKKLFGAMVKKKIELIKLMKIRGM